MHALNFYVFIIGLRYSGIHNLRKRFYDNSDMSKSQIIWYNYDIYFCIANRLLSREMYI